MRVHTYAHTHADTRKHAYTHKCTYTYTRTCTYTHVYTRTRTQLQLYTPDTKKLSHTHLVAVYCSVLKYVAQCYSVLQHVAVRIFERDFTGVCAQCIAVCCSLLYCVAVCCSVLWCIVVCCSMLQCVAVCCSMLQCTSSKESLQVSVHNAMQCVAE